MEIKLENGKSFKIKNISIDERDTLLDSVDYDYNNDGTVRQVKMMHSTITKWIRTCIDGDVSDKALSKLSLEDRTAIFTKLQNQFFLGEDKASK